jgi:hypothetical protein
MAAKKTAKEKPATSKIAFACTSALVLLGSGCAGSLVATAELPAPRAGAPVAPNVASLPTMASELFDFAPQTLTSRASLVRLDDGATCFDLLIRRPVMLPKDQRSLVLQISVAIDGAEASRRQLTLPVCTIEGSCLPPDSSLRSFTPENDARIRVEGQRLCFEGLPRARRELVLSADPGLVPWRFRFVFTGPPG